MSFILDALKKSEERRRQRETAAGPQQRRLRLDRSARPGRLTWLLWLLLPLGLAAGWLLRGSDSSPPGPAPAVDPPAAVRQELPLPPPAVPPREAVPAPIPKRHQATPSQDGTAGPPTDPRSEPGRADPLTAQLRKDQSESVPVVPSEPTPPPPRRAESPPSGEEWPLWSELSPESRNRMPRLAMSLHFYAPEPGRRLVRINDRLWREGDWLSDDLQLVEVTPEGARFDYLGMRFAVRAPLSSD